MTNQDDIPEIFRRNEKMNKAGDSVSGMGGEYFAAMKVVEELAGAYVEQTEEGLQNALALTQKAELSSGPEKERLMKKEVFRLVHDIKGQGATFGYPLMTDIGNKLCRYIESRNEFTPEAFERVRRHLCLLRRILENKVTDETSEEAGKILDEMKEIETLG